MQNQRLPSEHLYIHQVMDIRAAKSPAVSGDGEWFFFLSNASGTYQLWRAPWSEPTQATQITDMPEPIASFSINPKSRDVIFSMDCGGDERYQLWLLKENEPEPIPLTNDLNSIYNWGAWSPDGTSIVYASNQRHKHHLDIWKRDLSSDQASIIYQGHGYFEVVGFVPNCPSLLIRQWTHGPLDQTLFNLDLDTHQVTALLPHQGRATYGATRFRKDGSGFYILTDQGNEFSYIAFYDYATHGLNPVFSVPNHDIESYSLSPDQTKLALVVNEAGWDQAYVFDLATQQLDKIPHRLGTVSSLAWVSQGAGLIFAHEGATHSPDIFHYDLVDQTMTMLTDAPKGDVDQTQFVLPFLQSTQSFDGLSIPFFVYQPKTPKPSTGYPVMVYVHGGPASAWKANYRVDIQNLVAQGIMVVAPNVRGSTGYGRSYFEADDVTKRLDSVHDLRAIHHWISQHPDTDASRIGVAGQSYGGYMVLAALTEQPELWSLGVDFYGISNFLTMLETTGPWRRDARTPEYGDPVHDKAFLEHISPIRKMHLVKSPLLIVQGMEDPRVPPGESEMVYSVLRGLGQTVEIMRVPHEGHGFMRIDNRRAVFAKTAAFIQAYL